MYRAPTHHSLVTRLYGLTTLRAYGKDELMRKEFIENIEKSANATFCFVITNRWLALRIDLISLFFIISVAAFSIAFKSRVNPTNLAYTLQVTCDMGFLFSIYLRSFA